MRRHALLSMHYCDIEQNRYSMADLKQVHSGSLLRWMQEAAAAAEQHVMACTTCSAFGHFCEICRSDVPLFAFQVHIVAQCGRCNGFFHSACLRSVAPNCPRCARKRDKTMGMQLLQRMQVCAFRTSSHSAAFALFSCSKHACPPLPPLPPLIFPHSRCRRWAMRKMMREGNDDNNGGDGDDNDDDDDARGALCHETRPFPPPSRHALTATS